MLSRNSSRVFFVILILKILNANSFRLPNNSIPLSYNLWLKFNLESEKSVDFDGNVKINLRILESSEVITVHSKNLNIKSINLYDKDGVLIQNELKFDFKTQNEFLEIILPHKFGKNEEISLEISYSGKLIDKLIKHTKGIILASYEDANSTINFIFTEFQTTYARECFPCYDEPAIRAKFNLKLEHESSYDAIANMPVHARTPSSDSTHVITSFEETPPMQSYLLAFVISKFKYVQGNDIDVLQRIYAKTSRIDNGDVNYALIHIDKMLRVFEENFQIPYPLPKLDHVIGSFGTAIENWGLIGYSETNFFENDKFNIYRTIVHEIAHQYFGNLVSPKFWDYVWLSEGFAKFYDIEFLKLVLPDFEEIDRHLVSCLLWAFSYDVEQSSEALNKKVENHKEIEEKFQHFTYFKGAAILRMFQNGIGRSTFAKGITKYLNKHQYSSVDANDLHEALQEAINEDHPNNSFNINEMMRSWEDQTSFPIISVRIENETLILSQKCFHKNKNETYAVPITFTSPSYPDYNDLSTKYWLMNSTTLRIENFTDEWIILNNQYVGYYMVDYDDDLMDKILNQYSKNCSVFHYINRQWLFIESARALMHKYYDRSKFYKIMNSSENDHSPEVLNKRKKFQTLAMDINLVENNTVQDYYNHTPSEKNHAIELVISMMNQTIFDYDDNASLGFSLINETIYNHFLNLSRYVNDSTSKTELLYYLGCTKNVENFSNLLNIFLDFICDDSEMKGCIQLILFNLVSPKEKIVTFFEFIDKNYSTIAGQSRHLIVKILQQAQKSLKYNNYDEKLMQIRQKLIDEKFIVPDDLIFNFDEERIEEALISFIS